MASIETILITQARTGSTRLPGKVLLKVQGKELLKIHLDRLNECKKVDQIIVATTINKEDEIIANHCKDWGFSVSRGSVDDVLDRYYQAVKEVKPTWVVRVTSDCPLIDPALVDAVVSMAQVNDIDYCSNGFIENYPDGQDVEVFKFSALEKAWHNAVLKSEREHVTPYLKTNSDVKGGSIFKGLNFPCAYDLAEIRMTVDEHLDFELVEKLILDLGFDKTWLEYTRHIINKQLYKINSNIIRNEGYLKSIRND